MTHDDYMDLALAEAGDAFARGDWPVGALLVRDGQVLARGQNRQVTQRDATVHAETDALRRAFATHGTTDFAGATLYATMEPCPMCAYAARQAGVTTLVLGARHRDLNRTDLGTYAVEPFYALIGYPMQLVTGVRHAECLALRRQWGRDVTTR
jgi:tRNA(adenine34) deaminase